MSYRRLRTLEDLPEVRGGRTLVRCDFNVPLEGGRITDDLRIRAAAPTLLELLGRGVTLVLCSHLGRPKGAAVEEYRLTPVAARLRGVLDRDVTKLDEVTGPEVERAVAAARAGSIVLLENLRFEPGEERNDPGFADALARLADVYVDDAFGAAHRPHASIVGVAERLPSVAGRLMEREVGVLTKVRDDPVRPFAAILGGAKISDKLGMVTALVERVDVLLVGGAMAFSFLAAEGASVGSSLVEPDRFDETRAAVRAARARGVTLLLPEDVVVAAEATADAWAHVVPAREVPSGQMGLDIGPATIKSFAHAIAGARTILWNGPMGVFELQQFAEGTKGVAKAVAASSAFSVIGGGDSIAALAGLGLLERVSHVSTGGGASLEFIEGRALPGIEVLMAEEV